MQVTITARAWEKMRHYVDGCTGEVSGMGKVEVVEGVLTITDCTIFEQSVSGAHSDIETEALAKFQVELVKKGEDLSLWKLWWHSHADMGVFWSATDKGTIDQSTEFEYLVSLVTNHKHEIKCRVDTYKPLRLYADCTVEIEEEYDAELKASCDAEIAEKVKKPVYPAYKESYFKTPTNGVGFHTGGKYFDDDYFGDTYNADGTLRTKQPSLLSQGVEILPESDKAMEAYYDTLEELETEVMEAVDEATLSIATKMLWEHKQIGVKMGW